MILNTFVQTLERCATLDASLSTLARSYPSVKFLHARADKIGFASLSSSTSSTSNGTSNPHSIPEEYDDLGDDDFEEYLSSAPTQKTDLDVLPTILVYRGGQLVHTWVRVDWIVEAETGSSNGGGRSNGGMSFRNPFEGASPDNGIRELLEKRVHPCSSFYDCADKMVLGIIFFLGVEVMGQSSLDLGATMRMTLMTWRWMIWMMRWKGLRTMLRGS